jgi:hypothetical protein
MLLPAPEIVLKIVSPVLQYVVVLVFYLPPGPPARGWASNVLFRYRLVRYPAVLVSRFPRFPPPHLKVNIAGHKGVFRVPKGNPVQPPPGADNMTAPSNLSAVFFLTYEFSTVSYNCGCEPGLQTKMKCIFSFNTASQNGWFACKSSPKSVGESYAYSRACRRAMVIRRLPVLRNMSAMAAPYLL